MFNHFERSRENYCFGSSSDYYGYRRNSVSHSDFKARDAQLAKMKKALSLAKLQKNKLRVRDLEKAISIVGQDDFAIKTTLV